MPTVISSPVKHHGYLGDSLTGGFVLYNGGTFPSRFNGHCIAPNTRHSAMRWSTLEPRSSTFATRAAGDFLTTSDIWFRPIDSTVAPDGSLYVADWYDYNIAHSSPQNRSKWYQPSRADGRVWRISPTTPMGNTPLTFNLKTKSTLELVAYLSHTNAWYSRTARRILAERRDLSVVGELITLIKGSDSHLSLQALWAVHACGGLSHALAVETLRSPHPYVRSWTVRLLADRSTVSAEHHAIILDLSREDRNIHVRSQLACSAKRLPAHQALPILAQLLTHPEDAADPHLPLLCWWALEHKTISSLVEVLTLFDNPAFWKRPMVTQAITTRLSRRLAAEGTPKSYSGAARLLDAAPDDASRQLVLKGLHEAMIGRGLAEPPASLITILHRHLNAQPDNALLAELLLRMGKEPAAALRLATSRNTPLSIRSSLLQALGETRTASAVPVLLKVIADPASRRLHVASLSAMAHFDLPDIHAAVLASYPQLAPGARSQAIDLLASRPTGAILLLSAIRAEAIDSKSVTIVQVRRLLQHNETAITTAVTPIWGHVVPATALEKDGRIGAISKWIRRDTGEPRNGRTLYTKHCASCHKFRGEGTAIGPDLTGAERKDASKLIRNIVDPSSVIRPQYISHIAVTKDGRILSGLLAASNAETITLLDGKNKRTVIARATLESLKESPLSLMPEKLLEKLTAQEIRDLVSYLRLDGKPSR